MGGAALRQINAALQHAPYILFNGSRDRWSRGGLTRE